MDIKDAVVDYLAAKKHLTIKTQRWYSYHLERFSTWCEENKLTQLSQLYPIHIQTALSAYPTTNGYSQHGYIQVVKGFLRWCSEDEDMGVRERTIKRIELPHVEQSDVEIFTDAEVMKLFRTCERMPYPFRSKAIVHMLLDTGLRVSELCYDSVRPNEQTGLRLENAVFGKEGESYVWVMGKGRKSRTIGIGDETRKALKQYIHRERGNHASPYLFLAKGGEPLGVRMVEQFITDLGSAAGIDGCYPHRFRHTWAVSLLLNGTSDLVLMRLMGHSSLESTKVYIRAMTDIQARKAAGSVVDKIKRTTH